MRLFAKSPMEMRRQAEKEKLKGKRKELAPRSRRRRVAADRLDSPEAGVEQDRERDRRTHWLAYLRTGGAEVR